MGKFNSLTDQDRDYIRTVHSNSDLGWDLRMSMLMHKFGVSERTIRRWIKRLGFSSQDYSQVIQSDFGKGRQYDPDKKYYIITWAQNATPVHQAFWDNLLTYANHIDANVGVIQGRYQNPTSLWSKSMEEDEWWDDCFTVYAKDTHGNQRWLDKDGEEIDEAELVEYVRHTLMGNDFNDRRVTKVIDFSYLDSGRHNIHPYLDILADIKIKPTAHNPLSGFESLSSARTSVIGHPRVHLKSLPVLRGNPHKLLLTTGACTLRNYSDTKAGKKAEFHHTYGFVIVEIKDDLTYYIRQVTAGNDGSFTDLIYNVDNQTVTEVTECDAFVMGDIHTANVDIPTMESTMRLFGQIKPDQIVMHDLFDGESVNHHESKDPIKAYHRQTSGRNLVKREIDELKDFINRYDLIRYNPIVVRSNHDQWMERWIVDRDWKKDVANALEYMEYASVLLKGKAPKGIIPYILEQEYGDGITTLDLDESYKINGWEIAQHGHLGAHGSRGNIQQYRRLNTKVVVGDYHSPSRLDGAIGAGTYSKLRMGYNNGASAWMNAGVIIHRDGKAQHIIFQEDNGFTTLF